jgi:hypothetical protein
MEAAARSDGHTYSTNGLRRVNKNGTKEYKTLGGAWVSEGAVQAGYQRWGHDTYAQTAALSYEMRKASSGDEVQGIGDRYRDLATGAGGWGMSENLAYGAMVGAGYENADKHLEFKHMDTDGNVDLDAMAKEMYENRGTYNLAQMNGHTIEQMISGYDTADAQTQYHIQQVAENFMNRYGAGGMGAGADDEAIRAAAAAAGGGPGAGDLLSTNTPGSASTALSVRRLAVKTGVYQPQDPSTDVRSTGPPPRNPRLR